VCRKVRFLATKVHFLATKVRFLATKVRFLATKVRFLATKVRFLATKVRFLATKVGFFARFSRIFWGCEGLLKKATLFQYNVFFSALPSAQTPRFLGCRRS
jgi:outer membrane murein-binding lipoprotein Lpp